jgi:DNA polymerase III gamma/tau subunit
MIRHERADIPLVNIDHEQRISETAQLIPSRQIEKILKVHEKALVNLDANLNPRLVIENLLLALPLLMVI